MKVFVRILISVALLAFFYFAIRDHLPEIGQALKNVRPGVFLLALATMIVATLIIAKRLQIVFQAEGAPLSFKHALNLSFVGCFFNNFLPTSVGGDIVKIFSASKITKNPVQSVTSVLMDRIFGLFTFILIPSLSFIFFARTMEHPRMAYLIYSFFAVSLLSFLVLFNKNLARKFGFLRFVLRFFRLEEKVRKVYDGMNAFKNHKGVIVQALFLSIVSQFLSIASRFIVVLAVGIQPEPLHFLLLVPVVDLISMAPSLGGFGPREMAYIVLLSPYIGHAGAGALSVLWLAVLLVISLTGGLIYLLRPEYHVHLKEKDNLERSIKEAI